MKIQIRDILLVVLILFIVLDKYVNLFDVDDISIDTKTTENVVPKTTGNQSVMIPKPTQRETFDTELIPIVNSRLETNLDPTIINIKPTTLNNYQDDISIDDGVKFVYDIDVNGTLERFDYEIEYPEKTITIDAKTKVTKNRLFDFFLVGGYQVKPYPEYEIGIDFVTKKWKVGVRSGYDPTLNPIATPINKFEPTIKVEAGIRLFGY